MRNYLAASLAFHAALLLCALWLAERRPRPRPAPMRFEIALEGAEPRGREKSASPGRSGGKPTAYPSRAPGPRPVDSRKLRLSDVAPRFARLPSDGAAAPGGGTAHEERSTQDEGGAGGGRGGPRDAYDTAREMDLRREGLLYGFFEALWRRIDAGTPYPTDFAQKRITGGVTVHVGVDRRGVFTGRFLRVDASDPLLETYVMASLVHALHEPLPKSLWSDSDEMLLAVKFDFSIFGPGESPRLAEFPHLKNVLAFTRSSYVDPWLNQQIDRLLTHYMPPIIPIPGGFYIDFIRAYQLVKNYGKPDEEQKRDRRLENLREQWDEVVRRSGA